MKCPVMIQKKTDMYLGDNKITSMEYKNLQKLKIN